MNIEDLLREDEAAIVDEAWATVAHLDHYQRDGARTTRRKLEALYRQLVGAVLTRDGSALRAHSGRVARERFEAGYDLYEVQAAFTALGDAICRRALSRLPAAELRWECGLVGTALAHGRAALGRTFAALADRAPLAAPDASPALAAALDALTSRSADELVFPV